MLEKSHDDPSLSRYGAAPLDSLPLLENVPDHAMPSSLAMLLSSERRLPSADKIAEMLLTGPQLLQSLDRRVAADILLEFLREGGAVDSLRIVFSRLSNLASLNSSEKLPGQTR